MVRVIIWSGIGLPLLLGIADPALSGEPAHRQIPENTATTGTAGRIEGTVRYRSDPNRPWTWSRFYIRNPKEGYLAETVVALVSAELSRQAPAARPQSHRIDQINFQFAPETLAIRAGDTVRISNSDDALHNVMTSDGGQPFNVNVAKGQEIAHTFAQAGGLAGPIRLGCVFHGGMRAWIYVFDHPWFGLTGRDGKFHLENVPAGSYTLGVVHPAGKLHWSGPVNVLPNQTATVAISLSPDNGADQNPAH